MVPIVLAGGVWLTASRDTDNEAQMPAGNEPEAPEARPRGRGRRALRGLLLGLVGLFAFYLVAANVLLQTPFVEALTNKRPEKLLITYRRAFTFFPGHVLAFGVTVRNQASRSQLQISAEEAWAVVNPLPLFSREVRILRGKVYGPKVWLRSRPATVEEQRAAAPFVPPIAGLPFSLRVPLVHPRPSPWKVTVATVEVFDVREFWYQFLRVEGPGTVRGAFAIGPGSLVEVRWDQCDFPGFALTFRNEVVLPAAELHSTGLITPFDSREKDTAKLLQHFSGRAQVTGTAPAGVGAIQPFLAETPGLTFAGEPLRYDVVLQLDRGALASGTRVELATRRADVSYGDLRGSLGLDIVACRTEGRERGFALDLSAGNLIVRAGGRDTELASARQLHLSARLPDLPLAAPPERLALELVVADLRLEDVLDLPPRRVGQRTGPRTAPRLDVVLEGSTLAEGELSRGEDGAISARWGPVEFADLTATIDGRRVVSGGRFTSQGSLGPIPRGDASPRRWLSTVSGSLNLDLEVGPELAALDPLLGSHREFALSGGPVRVAVQAAVDHGRPAPRSTLTLRADRVGLRAATGIEARGAVDLRAVLSGSGSVGAAADRLTGAADVVLRGLELQFPSAGGTAIRGDKVVLRANADGIALHGLPRTLLVGADLSGLRVDGSLGARPLALSAVVPGTVRIDAEATTPRGGATLLRWGPLAIPGLAVQLDGQPLIEDLRLATSGTLGPVALSRRIDGRTLLETASGRLQLEAATPAGLAAIRGLLPADAEVGLGGAAARVSADVSLDRGDLVSGSHVAVKTAGLEVTASGVTARAAVDLAARLQPPAAAPADGDAPGNSELVLETTLSGIDVSHSGAPGASGTGASLVLSAHAPLGALQAPRKELDFALLLTDLRFQELTRLDDALPQKVQDDLGPDDLRLDAAVHGTAKVVGRAAFGPGSTFLLDGDTIDIPHFDIDVDGTSLFARATLSANGSMGPYDYGTGGRGSILPVTSGRATLTARTAAGLRAIDNLIKSVAWLDIEGGIGFVTLGAVIDKGSLKPGSNATVQLGELALKVTDFRAGGDADVKAWIASDEGGDFGALEVELSNVRVSREGTQGLAEADGATLSARTRDLRLGKAPQDVDVRIALRNARLDTVVGLNGLLPKGTGVTFIDGSARVDAELSGTSGGKDGRGSIRVRGERLAMSAPGYDFVGDLAVDVPLSNGDLVAGHFKIDGATVALKNFNVAGGETGYGDWTSGWWADIGVDDADLTLKGAIAADGDVSFRMRDTAPLVQFFTSRTHIPRFLARAMVVSDVSGRADLTYSPARVEVRDVEVVSDRAQAKARLQVDDRKPSGQLLVVYDWIGIGIGLDGKKTDLKLLGARHWYARLGPEPPGDLDAYVDEEIREWRDTQREFREKEAMQRDVRR